MINSPLSSTDPTGLSCSFLGVGVTNADPDGSDRDFGALNDFGCTRVLTEMASTAKSLFNGYIEQSHAEDRAIYQSIVDCGNNPGSCDGKKSNAPIQINVYCGGSLSAVHCDPPWQAISGS